MTTTKGRRPKCKQCGEWVDKSLEDFTHYRNCYYHNACYEMISNTGNSYQDLIKYAIDLDKIKKPTGKMMQQFKRYREHHKYTNTGMEYTLRFMNEIEHVQLREKFDSLVDLIPYYYEKARRYYANMAEIEASLKNVKIDNTPEIIYLTRPERKRRNKKINIEDL